MGRPPIDLKGLRFGKLEAQSSYNDGHQRVWLCACDCGASAYVPAARLSSGRQVSCGCLKVERIGALRRRHGQTRSPTWRSWQNMLTRCLNPKRERYKDYGGRGITVCKRWLKFENFLADMGERPEGLTLDRRNNNRGYSKANCRWATRSEQARNRRMTP